MIRRNLEQQARRVLSHSSRNRFVCSCTALTLWSPSQTTLQSRLDSASLDRKAEISTVLEQWRYELGNKVNPSLVRGTIEKLRDSQRFRHALEVSDWMIQQNITSFVPEDFAARFHLTEKVSGLEEAEKFFASVPENLRGESLYTALLNSYSGRRALDKAESTFKKMKELGLLLRPSPYNSMTSLYSSMGNREKVDEILRAMKEGEIELDSVSVNNALRVYAAVCDVATMEEFLGDWEASAEIAWDTRLDMAKAYLRDGSKEKASEMLSRTEKPEDPESYEELMRLYGEAGKREAVYRIWDMYKETREESNQGFLALIASLLKLGDIKGAEKVYTEEWECSGLEFDVRIPTLLASGYRDKGMLSKAFRLMSKTMRKREFVRPITPLLEEWGKGNSNNPSDLRDLIKNLRDSNQLSKALEALTWMGEKTTINLFPEEYAARVYLIENVLGLEEAEKFFETSIPEEMKDQSVYTSLLTAYSKSLKNLAKAEAIFDKMRNLKFLSSNLSPFNSMISLYSQFGRKSEVESLLYEMRWMNVEPDSVTMNNVLRLYADEDDTDIYRMEQYKTKADDKKTKLEVRTMVAMRKAYERVAMRKAYKRAELLKEAMEIATSQEEVHHLWNEYKKMAKSEIGNEGYPSVISSLLKLGDVKGAEKIYGEWESQGPEFDYRIHGLLISRYCEANDEVKVREVVDSVRKKQKRMQFKMLLENTNPTILFVGYMAAACACLWLGVLYPFMKIIALLLSLLL